MISDKILKDCYCSLESSNHFLIEPLQLTCGHSACKKCIGNKEELRCIKCRIAIKNKGKFVKSKASEDLIKMHVGDLLLKLEERFKMGFESFKSNISVINQKKLIFQKFSSILFSRQYFII